MKKFVIGSTVLLILFFALFVFTRQIQFPSDAQSEFDVRLKSWAGSNFNYEIVALKNASNFNAEGPWCIQIKPSVQIVDPVSGKADEINHFSMLKEGQLWVMVRYDPVNQTNWSKLGCGDWK